jgi:hypothetical protein
VYGDPNLRQQACDALLNAIAKGGQQPDNVLKIAQAYAAIAGAPSGR